MLASEREMSAMNKAERKSRVAREPWEGTSSRRKPVFGLDIDGTLGDFHGHFLRYAEGWLGKPVDLNYDARTPLYRHLHISKQTYRQIKLAYRMGGLKRSMPALPWASDLTRTLRSWGAEVYICTTRPYLSHDNIDTDTRHWLRRSAIACKGIIWGEHKYRELARTVGRNRIVTVLDDIPEMCEQAKRIGIDPVFAIRPHNLLQWEMQMSERWDAASDFEETVLVLKEHLENWRGKA